MNAPFTDIEKQAGTDICAAVLSAITGLKPQTARKHLNEQDCSDYWCAVARLLMNKAMDSIGGNAADLLKVTR